MAHYKADILALKAHSESTSGMLGGEAFQSPTVLVEMFYLSFVCLAADGLE